MFFLFTVIPRVTATIRLQKPLLLGFISYFIGQGILSIIPAPEHALTVSGYALIALSLLFDGFGAGILAMLAESLVALHVDKNERARVMAVQHTIIMLATAPFGWISGLLSSVSRTLPFRLTGVLILLGIIATLRYYRTVGEIPQETSDNQ